MKQAQRGKNKKALSHVSLFSGCGGFDLGFIEAGFNCVAAYDIDPLVIDVHKKNLNTPAMTADLSSSTIPLTRANLDVLIAGPPCQGFSTAGKRRLNDPRNQLLVVAGEIAEKILPKVVVVENVAGVTAGSHRQYWVTLRQKLKTAGYHIAEIKCEGTKMGVSQTRTRMVMLAWRNGKDVQVSIPEVKGGVLMDALANIGATPNHITKILPSNSDLACIARKIRPGQKLSNVRGGPRAVHTWDIPGVFGKTTVQEKLVLETILRLRRQNRIRDYGDADPVPVKVLHSEMGGSVIVVLKSLEKKGFVRQIDGCYDITNTFNGKFRRLSWDKPSLTVDTRFGNPRYFLHPSEDRGFTVREAARIQGFPDSFVFHGSEAEQYRMVGNAVPPPLAKCLATFIRDAILS